MFMITSDFHFWNRAKAGMFMKTIKLREKAGMLYINNDVTSSKKPRPDHILFKEINLTSNARNVYDPYALIYFI
jgi:hypothetical protein